MPRPKPRTRSQQPTTLQVDTPSLGELRQYPETNVPSLRMYERTYWFLGKPAASVTPNPAALGSGTSTDVPAESQYRAVSCGE
jgi:hypothetical protein